MHFIQLVTRGEVPERVGRYFTFLYINKVWGTTKSGPMYSTFKLHLYLALIYNYEEYVAVISRFMRVNIQTLVERYEK